MPYYELGLRRRKCTWPEALLTVLAFARFSPEQLLGLQCGKPHFLE